VAMIRVARNYLDGYGTAPDAGAGVTWLEKAAANGSTDAMLTRLVQGDDKVQAATFAQFDNARRAASRLAQAGEARIVPTTRNGAPFYRVLVSRPNGDAGLLRARVAQIGFPEAQVRSF